MFHVKELSCLEKKQLDRCCTEIYVKKKCIKFHVSEPRLVEQEVCGVLRLQAQRDGGQGRRGSLLASEKIHRVFQTVR